MSEPARPSRSVRPWELSSAHRPVWAYPTCPEGHGRIFVGKDDAGGAGRYRCHAPWCPEGAFEPPEGWEREIAAELERERA